jgi:hypothetical protein
VQRITLCAARDGDEDAQKLITRWKFGTIYIYSTPSIPTTETTHGFCEEKFDEEAVDEAPQQEAPQSRQETREAQRKEASRQATREASRSARKAQRPTQETLR